MRPALRLAAAGALCGALAACAPVPAVFEPPEEEKRRRAAALVPAASGVGVRRIEGPAGWVGDALARAIARSLRDRGLVAGARGAEARPLLLDAGGYRAERAGGPAELAMIWTLRGRDGAEIARRETRHAPPAAFWTAPTPEMFRDVADRHAGATVAWIEGVRARRHRAPPPLPPPAAGPAVALEPVAGAPGDGAEALAAAIRRALAAEGIAAGPPGRGGLALVPSVAVAPAGAGVERVAIAWVLRDPSGAEIGRVDQANAIPAGALDGPWGATADDIAAAAAPGIADLARGYAALAARTGGAARLQR